jgi:hypothetical protein
MRKWAEPGPQEEPEGKQQVFRSCQESSSAAPNFGIMGKIKQGFMWYIEGGAKIGTQGQEEVTSTGHSNFAALGSGLRPVYTQISDLMLT